MKHLKQTIASLHGAPGESWLRSLPSRLTMFEKQHQCQLHPPFSNLTYHYVAPCTGNNRDAWVLKCGFPGTGLAAEIEALTFFNGNGVVQLIDADPEEGWLLLERCSPGVPIAALKDDEATKAAVETMQTLWRASKGLLDNGEQHVFPSIRDWLTRLDKKNSAGCPVPDALMANARSMVKELLSSPGKPTLLHGDLHHDNILSATRQPYLAIDPKGIIGEREYEIGALMRNPYSLMAGSTQLDKLCQRRLSVLVELTGFDQERLLMWSFVQAVLSACWHVDDRTDGADVMVGVAGVFLGLISLRKSGCRGQAAV